MTKDKQIQISEKLFLELLAYVCNDTPTYAEQQNILRQFQDKIKRMTEHDLYTIYKTCHDEKEREKARLEYLDSKGIPKSFRW